MLSGPSLLISLLGPSASNTAPRQLVLSSPEASSLRLALTKDGGFFVRCATISFVHACNDLMRGWYSWPTVKLYYSAFYSALAMLNFEGHCLFHHQRKPWSVEAEVGAQCKGTKGSTHKTACEAFATLFGHERLLSQEIDNMPPLVWLMRRREETNYTGPGFAEPEAPPHFQVIEEYGLRRLLATYIGDETDLYTFDPQHAMICFTLKMLQRAKEKVRDSSGQAGLEESVKAALLKKCRDSAGPIPALRELID